MIHLITGGSGSGKSAFAEECIKNSDAARRFYLATMKVWGEEGRRRVEKHRKMREGKGFETIECETDLKSISLSQTGTFPSAVLLECMSNLVANEMFEKGGTETEICERVLEGIKNLERQTQDLVIVTNEVFSDGCEYDEDTIRYIDLLAEINQRLAGISDRVTEVVFGIPVCLKSDEKTEKTQDESDMVIVAGISQEEWKDE